MLLHIVGTRQTDFVVQRRGPSDSLPKIYDIEVLEANTLRRVGEIPIEFEHKLLTVEEGDRLSIPHFVPDATGYIYCVVDAQKRQRVAAEILHGRVVRVEV